MTLSLGLKFINNLVFIKKNRVNKFSKGYLYFLKETMNMKNFFIIIFSLIIISCSSNEDLVTSYPTFGNEINVTINGLSFDAMEPFISPSGNYLFFNSVNDGINTKLYYATRVNDSTFNFVDELFGANQTTTPQLNAVADMDVNGNFYWTSTRNYPTELNNLHYGTFNAGTITNIGRVEGNFNMNTPGWLVMDHGISLDGQFLYYNNARFDDTSCVGPCETHLGIAEKTNSNTFETISNSSEILQNINNSNYIYYAPCISSDNLELYYTRFLKGTITSSTVFDICVAVRDNSTSVFSEPKVLFSKSIATLIEAPTLTTDKKIMYYHEKTASSHKIMMRKRNF